MLAAAAAAIGPSTGRSQTSGACGGVVNAGRTAQRAEGDHEFGMHRRRAAASLTSHCRCFAWCAGRFISALLPVPAFVSTSSAMQRAIVSSGAACTPAQRAGRSKVRGGAAARCWATGIAIRHWGRACSRPRAPCPPVRARPSGVGPSSSCGAPGQGNQRSRASMGRAPLPQPRHTPTTRCRRSAAAACRPRRLGQRGVPGWRCTPLMALRRLRQQRTPSR